MVSAGESGGLRLVFAGGGTGGHLYPAIAIAEEVRKRRPEAEITFIGTEQSLESRVVPARGYRFASITVSGFRRAFSLRNVLIAGKLVSGIVQSFRLLRALRPDVVIGTGGYVCGPPVYAASLLGIPTLIQEQNSYPGVTTRLLAGRVREVHITFERTRDYLRRTDGVFLTGNPVRAEIGRADRRAATSALGLEASMLTVLVFGGSQGAASINNAVLGILPGLVSLGVQVVWLTGGGEYERVCGIVRARGIAGIDRVKIFPYVEQMQNVYGVADIAVCRAGATTIAELMCVGVPSVLIPYPRAAADHQTENAKALAEAGAAVVLRDSDVSQRLLAVLGDLVMDQARRRLMGERARALGAPRAAELLAEAVFRLAEA
jgi:UDP-N-acetylglucosamine--N-acetylmuramyl-(pentapeptide) pyrophosphoryl-undecaprenol N-acetylglucosamine transferase